MKRSPFLLATTSILLLIVIFSISGCAKKVVPPPPAVEKVEPPPPPPPPPPAPTLSLKASPSAIEKGQPTTITWNSTNATNISIDNGIGTVEASGSRTVRPSESTTYMAKASGPGGNATSEARVTVTPPPAVTPPPPPVITDAAFFESNIKDAFFDYDQYGIRSDAQQILIKNAQALAQRPSIRITIEGHCDERGSEKYNLALGDRRAISAKDFLVSQGVDASRIDTISYGEERPFCEEKNEDCWKLNRRAHFVMR
jgi:peptidoglycan-associated lipoprotein